MSLPHSSNKDTGQREGADRKDDQLNQRLNNHLMANAVKAQRPPAYRRVRLATEALALAGVIGLMVAAWLHAALFERDRSKNI